MDWISKLPPWLGALALSAIAGAFVYVAVEQPGHFKFASLEFGGIQQADLSFENAVVAYAIRVDVNDRDNQCPDGWTPFEEARGRFIIGAGTPSHSDFRKWQPLHERNAAPEDLTTRKPMEHGGEEEHTLTVAEMPQHAHTYDAGMARVNGDGGAPVVNSLGTLNPAGHGKKDRVKESGSGAAHNIMPPFIALYFCKKD